MKKLDKKYFDGIIVALYNIKDKLSNEELVDYLVEEVETLSNEWSYEEFDAKLVLDSLTTEEEEENKKVVELLKAHYFNMEI